MTGQTTGEGIKKTPAYETPLTKNELDKWRKEFWGKTLDQIYEFSVQKRERPVRKKYGSYLGVHVMKIMRRPWH